MSEDSSGRSSEVPNPSMSVENLVSLPDQDGHSQACVAKQKSGSGKPLKKPCILCSTEIPASSIHCFTCRTTQIEDELKHSRFKLCSNPKCKTPMSVDLQVCYRCKQDQDFNRVRFQSESLFHHQISSNTECNSQVESVTKDGSSQSQQSHLAHDRNLKTNKIEPNKCDQQQSDGTTVSCVVDDSANICARKDNRKHNDGASSTPVDCSSKEAKHIGEKAPKSNNSKTLVEGEKTVVGVNAGLFPQCDGEIPPGFKTSMDSEVMRITFHALLPVQCWGIQEPKIYLRFGNDALGQWKYDHGPGSIESDYHDGFLLVKFPVFFHAKYLKGAQLNYKYMVYSTEVTNESGQACEFLHGHDSSNVERCLEVPEQMCIANSIFRHYDTTIYPETVGRIASKKQSQGWLLRLAELGRQHINDMLMLKETFRAKKPVPQEDEILIPPHDTRQQICIEHHLIPSKKLFVNGDFYDTYDISTATDCLVHLYNNCYSQKVFVPGESCYTVETESLKQVIIMWLENMMNELDRNAKKIERQKQFLSVISLLVTYRKLRIQFCISSLMDEVLLMILNMVSVSPSGDEYNYLLKMMKTHKSKSEVQDALVELFNHFQKKIEIGNLMPMLKIVPLIHFLNGSSAPFSDQRMEVCNISWEDLALNTNALRDALRDEFAGFMEKHLLDVKAYFNLDPLMVVLFVYLCPEDNLPVLCDHVPLYMVIAVICHTLQSNRYPLKKFEVDTYLNRPLSAIQKKLSNKETVMMELKKHEYTYAAFKELMTTLLNCLTADDDHHHVQAVVNCVVTVLSFASNLNYDNKMQYTNEVQIFLKMWLETDSVTGGVMFGHCNTHTIDIEVKVWESVFQYCDTAEIVEEELKTILMSLLNDRIAHIPHPEVKIRILFYLEKRRQPMCNETVINAVMDHAVESLKQMFSSPQSKQQISLFHSFFETAQSSQSSRIANMFGSLLDTKYPNYTESLSLTELLEWELWPGFIKMFGKYFNTDV